QPISAAAIGACSYQRRPGARRRCPSRLSGSDIRLAGADAASLNDAPSISHTNTGSVTHSTGQAKKGGMASTERAPVASAAPRLRQPLSPRTRSASSFIETLAGMGSLRRHWVGTGQALGWHWAGMPAAPCGGQAHPQFLYAQLLGVVGGLLAAGA